MTLSLNPADNAPAASAARIDGIDPRALFGSERGAPTTAAQREIFSAALSDPVASRGYNHSISIFLQGALDLDALYSALLNLLDRHEALRGRFSPDGNQFLVREQIPFELPLCDLADMPEADRNKAYLRLIREELDHVFDLLEGPLFRAFLVKRGQNDHILVFNCHHAIVDGWSLKIILDELPRLYSDLVRGSESATLPASASFLEYLPTAVERESEHADDTRAYWLQVFAQGAPALELPIDNRRPLIRSYESLREDYRINREIYTKLKTLGTNQGTSQFITLLSSFALYISRISAQKEFVIGVPIAGQITSGLSGLLGHDARVLPILCKVEEGDSFATFSRRMMDTFLSAYDHQWISIPELLRTLKIRIEQDRAPLIQVMFNFDPGMDQIELCFEDLTARHFFNHRNAETFEFSINCVVEGPDLVLEWAYNQSLFDAAAMHQRMQQFECLMASIASEPQTSVDLLPLLPADQTAAMDAALNSTAMEFERDSCTDQLIQRTALSTPSKIAVICGEHRLTYEQLWARSGKMAAALRREDLGPTPFVGVMVERSADMLAVLLGVWRAGAAFVPLDPAYPADRLDYMIQHSDMRVLLTQNEIGWQAKGALKILDVDQILAGDDATFPPVPSRNSNDLAYVIYTSGSTGKPKGVQVPHVALVNFLTTMQTQKPGISAQDQLLAVTTLSFDIAELELWLPLVAGATTVVADRATVIDGLALQRTLHDEKITFLQATPSTWRLLLASGWEGDANLTAMCGGEALPRDLAGDLMHRVKVLWNAYGPTETTVWSTIDQVESDEVTIGKPIGNTQAYILDAHQNWVPWGSLGELWLGGDGVTHGYLDRDDLTRERFIANPFTGRGKMYRTGDVVRLRRDGCIDYVGRNDFQVKLRGYRIELSEVQLALSRLPKIRQCAVVVREKEPNDPHLVAFYTANEGAKPTVLELRQGLRESLPDYMVPSRFVELDRLPLTDNGKIDIKSLPDPFKATEATTAEVSAELLSVESLLSEHPHLSAAALATPPGSSPDTRPIAFLVAADSTKLSTVAIRKYLRGRCPEKMIPQTIVYIDALPQRDGETVDRACLIRLLHDNGVSGGSAQGESNAPRTPTEVLLSRLWCETLKIPQAGTNERFFDLGGHSLLSIQMIARVESETGFRIVPRHVLMDTLGQLANRVAEGMKKDANQ